MKTRLDRKIPVWQINWSAAAPVQRFARMLLFDKSSSPNIGTAAGGATIAAKIKGRDDLAKPSSCPVPIVLVAYLFISLSNG